MIGPADARDCWYLQTVRTAGVTPDVRALWALATMFFFSWKRFVEGAKGITTHARPPLSSSAARRAWAGDERRRTR